MEIRLANTYKGIIAGTVKEKTCIGPCAETKPLSEFPKNPNHADGHGSTCKACIKERNKARYDKKKTEMELRHF